MRGLVTRFDALPSFWRILVSAVAQALPFYFAAFLGHWIGEVAKNAGISGLMLHGSVVVVVLVSVLAVRGYFGSVRRELHASERTRRDTLVRAHNLVDRIVSNSLADIVQTSPAITSAILFSSRERLNRIMQAVYDVFEGAYGSSGTGQPITFEATFMTKSFLDGFITIPAHANRDGRAPQSLNLRAQDKELYDKTVTAVVYRDPNLMPRIIEDTKKDPLYTSLYSGQDDRIKSMIVYPVRNARNVLLGTLVVHCDSTNFFRRSDERYWSLLLEIFAKRLAHEKAKMERGNAMRASGSMTAGIDIPDPPF